MQQLGNAKVNSIFESKLSNDEKLNSNCTNEERKTFIHAKYQHKRFIEPMSNEEENYVSENQ